MRRTAEMTGSGVAAARLRGPVRALRMASAARLTRLAVLGLIAVLVGMVTLTVLTGLYLRNYVDEVEQAHRVEAAYNDVTRDFMASQLTALELLGDPSPAFLESYREGHDRVVRSLEALAAEGDPADAELAREMQSHFVPLSQAFIDVVEEALPRDVAEPGLYIYERLVEEFARPAMLPHTLYVPDGATVPVSPDGYGWEIYVSAMTHHAQEKEAEAGAATNAFRERLDQSVVLLLVLNGAGILLALAFLYAIRVFGRRAADADAEMRKLREAAHTDALTNLGNRRAFEETAGWLLANGAGHLVLVVIDVDEFKEVNDTFGHERGDGVLRDIARIMRSNFGDDAALFRIGGDEFAVLFAGTPVSIIRNRAELARRQAEKELGGPTLSIGIVSPDRDVTDADVLGQEADAALYEAKMHGRNMVVVYDRQPGVAPRFPAESIAGVRQLLVEGDVRTVFQPIWKLDGSAVFAYEALTRPAEHYGLTGPMQAFEIAERLGRVAELDRICIARILASVDELPDDALLFINISAYSLTHHSFDAKALRRDIEAAGLTTSRVVFEITENSPLAPEVIVRAVEALHAAGFSVALDDVGVGSNGLDMLRKLNFEFVKVDREVVRSALEDGKGRAAFIAMLAFASEAQARVVAEGIEDTDMLELVRTLSENWNRPRPGLVHGVQGYLLGKPAPSFVDPGDETRDQAA